MHHFSHKVRNNLHISQSTTKTIRSRKTEGTGPYKIHFAILLITIHFFWHLMTSLQLGHSIPDYISVLPMVQFLQ